MRQRVRRPPGAPPATAAVVLLLLYGLLLYEKNAAADAATELNNNDNVSTEDPDFQNRGEKKFGDKCEETQECGFRGSMCDSVKKSCQCIPELTVTNHIDKCGKAATVNESCFFNEQCETTFHLTECRDGRCACKFEKTPVYRKDGTVDCVVVQEQKPVHYMDPAMIGVLVGMALMFIIICVVLRLFSNKLLHGERRGSRGSVRAPSRQPSMASLRPHSPNSQGSRRGSRGSSNASNKSPSGAAPATTSAPMLENVTVDVQAA